MPTMDQFVLAIVAHPLFFLQEELDPIQIWQILHLLQQMQSYPGEIHDAYIRHLQQNLFQSLLNQPVL
jgi:hypothetical protein